MAKTTKKKAPKKTIRKKTQKKTSKKKTSKKKTSKKKVSKKKTTKEKTTKETASAKPAGLMVEKIVFDRSRWVRCYLVTCDGEQGQYCAVGAYLTALGVPPKKMQGETGCTAERTQEFIKDVPEEGRWVFKANLGASTDARNIMRQSDSQKEAGVIRLFQRHGVQFKFTGKYKHVL